MGYEGRRRGVTGCVMNTGHTRTFGMRLHFLFLDWVVHAQQPLFESLTGAKSGQMIRTCVQRVLITHTCLHGVQHRCCVAVGLIVQYHSWIFV